VTAVVRSGNEAAQMAFLVRTNWPQFHFGPQHKVLNPYENVLSPATVGTIDLLWRFRAAWCRPRPLWLMA
jgi:hypothetical protein